MEYALDIYYSYNGYKENPVLYKSMDFVDLLKHYFNRCMQMIEAVNQVTVPPKYDYEKEKNKYTRVLQKIYLLSQS